MPDVCWSFPVQAEPPKTGESLLGYLFRVATWQGLKRLKNLYQVASCPRFHKRFYNSDLSPFAFLLAQSEARLAELNFNDPAGRLCKEASWFRGQRLNAWQINQKRPKLCLSCMREDLLIHDFWDISLFLICPNHQEYLTRYCPECGRGLSWTRPEVTTCFCGANFADQQQPKADSGVLRLTRLMASALGETCCYDFPGYPQGIYRLQAAELMQLIGLIGLVGTGRSGVNLKQIRKLSFEDKVHMLKTVDEVLCDWPHSFHRFLWKIKGVDKVGRPTSYLHEQLGSFYTRLAYGKKTHFRFVTKEMRYFEEKHQSVRDEVVPPAQVNTTELQYALKQLKISPRAILSSAEAGGLDLVKQKRYRVPSRIVIKEDSLKKFKRRAKNRLTIAQAREILGLSQKPLQHLVNCGVLTKDSRTVFDGRADYSLIKSEILKLLSNLNHIAKPFTHADVEDKLIDVGNLLRAAPRNESVKLIMSVIVDGEIPVYSMRKNGNFRDFRFCSKSVRRFVVHYIRGISEDLLDYEEAEEKYNLSEGSIRRMLVSGGVKSEKRKYGCRTYQLISKQSMDQWLANNIALHEVVKELDLPPKKAQEELRSMGIHPTLSTHGGIGTIWYGRQRIERLKVVWFA